MASANLDLVRSTFAAWELGDFSAADWAHHEIELVRPDGPSPGRGTGLAGMADGTRDWLNVWEDIRFDVDEYRELDDERVLVLVRYSGRGKASGLELGQMRTWGANVHQVRDGKVTKHVLYYDLSARSPTSVSHRGPAPPRGPHLRTRACRLRVGRPLPG